MGRLQRIRGRRATIVLVVGLVVLGLLVFSARQVFTGAWPLGGAGGMFSSGSQGWPLMRQPNTRPVCTNTCEHARNGVCNEGRHPSTEDQSSIWVECDLGSDCEDCGPWAGHLPDPTVWGPESPAGVGPILWVRGQGEKLFVKATTTVPSFNMAITESGVDPDLSAMLHNYGHMEGGITRAAHSFLSKGCLNASLPGGRALVLVVGAAQGYFTLYAAAMGCRVVAWEPVRLLRTFLEHGVAINNMSHLIQVRPYAVSDLPAGSNVSIGVAKHGTYWGLASVNNLNLHPNEVRETVEVMTERLDDVVPPDQPILMLKVDVEGYEPEVLRSARRIISNRQATHIMTEYSPGIAERHKDWTRLRRLSGALELLLYAGYKVGHMPTFTVAAPWPPGEMKEWYDKPFPTLEEVGLPELEADVKAADLRLRTEDKHDGQCQVPPDLAKWAPWRSCEEWTRTVHPKGFRSSFGYNTNLWASLHANVLPLNTSLPSPVPYQDGVLQLRGNAALFGRDQPLSGPGATWHSLARPNVAIAFLPCEKVGVEYRLVYRCPCPDKGACGEEEDALTKMTQADGVFFKY